MPTWKNKEIRCESQEGILQRVKKNRKKGFLEDWWLQSSFAIHMISLLPLVLEQDAAFPLDRQWTQPTPLKTKENCGDLFRNKSFSPSITDVLDQLLSSLKAIPNSHDCCIIIRSLSKPMISDGNNRYDEVLFHGCNQTSLPLTFF